MTAPAFVPALPLARGPPACAPRAAPARHRPRAALATPPPPLRPPHRDETPDHPPSPALPLVGRPALDDVLLETPPDTVLVVMFHARWCRVCKTLAAKLPRVAVDYPALVWRSVDFAEPDNKPLCSELGVKLLPTFRFYRGGMPADAKPLDQFTTGPFGVKRLVEHVERLRDDGFLHN